MDLGANELTTFRKVTLPLIAPAILAGALLSFALSIDDFVITYFNAGSRDHVPDLRLGLGAAWCAAAGQRLRYRDLRRRADLDGRERPLPAPTGRADSMSTEVAPAQIDRERVKELTARESKRLDEATQGSKRMFERARQRAHGRRPLLVSGARALADLPRAGRGRSVWDVDGRRLWDFHNGFGSMPQGHAHPAIVEGGREARSGSARTSPRPPRTASSSRRSSHGASACRGGASTTRAPRRRWTRSASRAP